LIKSFVFVFNIQFIIGKDSLNSANEIEKYESALKNMLGTTEAARDRMKEYFAIAAETPFDLPQVIEAGNKLQALGRYSEDNVKMLGDLAAASGKPMEQALNAFAKMASGQKGIAVDMFRDLMITVDDWTAATGKGVSKSGELLASTDELLAALPKIMKSKGYFGMMATQAETTAGKIANLEDGVYQLKVAMGERLQPTVRRLIEMGSRMVDNAKSWVEIPAEQKIAREKAEMNLLVESLIANNDNEEIRKTLIDQINSKYPDFLKNLDLEKSSVEDIRKELEGVNEEYDKKTRKAYYQSVIDDLQKEDQEAMNDVLKYQNSIMAKEQIKEVNAQIADFMSSMGLDRDWKLDGKGGIYRDYVGIGSVQRQWKPLPDDQKARAAELYSNKKSLESYTYVFDKNRLEKAQKKSDEIRAKMEVFNKLMDGVLGAESNGGGSSNGGNGSGEGSGNGSGNGNPTSLTNAAETVADSISGGGRQIKNFYITINDGLVKEVINNFSSSDDNPETAAGFMDKLSSALQNVVNDVNYAAS